jgi:tRNA (guanosine-2'-O-)-methyltransferase
MSIVEISDRRKERLTNTVLNRLNDLTIVAEGTHLRHNLSAIIRTAESFGVSRVHLISSESKKMSGAAKGAERWVELVIHKDTEQCFDYLKSNGFKLFVADFQNNSYTPDTIPIDEPVAIIMGTELVGVSDKARSMADGSIIIPMYGLTQSLNVSVASACILQRISARMRADGIGGLSDGQQADLLNQWLERDRQEKVQRNHRRKLAKPQIDVQD